MSERFERIETAIDGLYVLQRKPIRDARGYLERMFCTEELEWLLGERQIRQINRTRTGAQGTVRGLHFQLTPHAETKLVSCLGGRVFDVAVDVRAGSPTFLQWHGEELSEENGRTLVIPEGFAHGFQTLTADCRMLYVHTAAYTPEAERGLHACDPSLSIDWPLPITEQSGRDQRLPLLTSDFRGITL